MRASLDEQIRPGLKEAECGDAGAGRHHRAFSKEVQASLKRVARLPYASPENPDHAGLRSIWVKSLHFVFVVGEAKKEIQVVAVLWRQELNTGLEAIGRTGSIDEDDAPPS